MTEALCPKCGTSERHRSPSGLQAWCKPCHRATQTARKHKEGGRLRLVTPAMAAKAAEIAAEIAAGVRHVVAEIAFGTDRFVVCSCALRLVAQSDEALDRAFAGHRSEVRRAG